MCSSCSRCSRPRWRSWLPCARPRSSSAPFWPGGSSGRRTSGSISPVPSSSSPVSGSSPLAYGEASSAPAGLPTGHAHHPARALSVGDHALRGRAEDGGVEAAATERGAAHENGGLGGGYEHLGGGRFEELEAHIED